jgi:hypothetical protein
MSLQTPASETPEALDVWEDESNTARASYRACLIFLVVASALGYELAFGAASLTWSALVGG